MMNLASISRRIGAAFVCLLGLFGGGLASSHAASSIAPTPPGKRLLLFVGSNTLGERAIPELARSYLEKERKAKNVGVSYSTDLVYVTGTLPDGAPVYIEVHPTGSGDAFKSLAGLFPGAKGPCDIGMSSRRVEPYEAAALKEKMGSDFTQEGAEPGEGCEHPVAMDGIAIIVHKDVPIWRISFGELRSIFSKKTTNWNQTSDWKNAGLGSDGGLPVVAYRRKEPSGTLDFFKQQIRPDGAAIEQLAAFTSSSDLVKKVASTPGSIAFVGCGYATAPGIKRLQVYNESPPASMKPEDALFPDPSTVRQDSYPLARVLYLYTPVVTVNSDVKPFIRFSMSEDGQSIIADAGSLIRVEGTLHELERHQSATGSAGTGATAVTLGPSAAQAKRKAEVILRLHGSNTVGAECAVELAYNYLIAKYHNSRLPIHIEDKTVPLSTPEGETAEAHDIECDLDGTGIAKIIEIRPTGSSDAFRDLLSGDCDVGMSSRPITDSEERALLPVCGNLALPAAQYPLGLDALAIVVNPQNRVEKLTLEQVRRIFLGEIKDWSEVGGDRGPIHLHTRADRSGTYKTFCDSVLLGRLVAPAATRHAENSLEADAIEGDPSGIGFVPMSQTGKAKALLIGNDGAQTYWSPSEETVRSGKYPAALCRYVYLYVPESRPKSFTSESIQNWPAAHEFAEMSQEWRGQALVANSGFVTDTVVIDDGSQARRIPGENLQRFLQRLCEFEKKAHLQKGLLKPKLAPDQLCARLLFYTDQSVLTPESVNMIERKLGPWLKMYPSVAKAGLVAEGWTDSVGADDFCKQLSLKRAETVAAYIYDKLGIKVASRGMGKSFDPPNTSELNKQQNRCVVIRLASALESGAGGGEAMAAATPGTGKTIARHKPK